MRMLNLYTTLGCHLCNEAETMIANILFKQKIADVELVSVEISESETLVEDYGVRIPVIRFQHTENELAWPFTEAELGKFLELERELSSL